MNIHAFRNSCKFVLLWLGTFSSFQRIERRQRERAHKRKQTLTHRHRHNYYYTLADIVHACFAGEFLCFRRWSAFVANTKQDAPFTEQKHQQQHRHHHCNEPDFSPLFLTVCCLAFLFTSSGVRIVFFVCFYSRLNVCNVILSVCLFSGASALL